MKWTYSLLLICLLGCGGVISTPEYVFQAEADATAALAMAADPVLPGDDTPAPDDKPKPGDKCSVCNGTGQVGDGRIMKRCDTCGGDGRIDERDLRTETTGDEVPLPPVAVEPVQQVKRITLHVTKDTAAGWPQDWWRGDRLRLIEQGFEVVPVREEVSPHADAWFEVENGGHKFVMVGNQPIEAFR